MMPRAEGAITQMHATMSRRSPPLQPRRSNEGTNTIRHRMNLYLQSPLGAADGRDRCNMRQQVSRRIPPHLITLHILTSYHY